MTLRLHRQYRSKVGMTGMVLRSERATATIADKIRCALEPFQRVSG